MNIMGKLTWQDIGMEVSNGGSEIVLVVYSRTGAGVLPVRMAGGRGAGNVEHWHHPGTC